MFGKSVQIHHPFSRKEVAGTCRWFCCGAVGDVAVGYVAVDDVTMGDNAHGDVDIGGVAVG